MNSTSIVIVSFNAREHLEHCLEAVAGGGHEVVVVDNASSDGSPALRSLYREDVKADPGAVRIPTACA